jgi:hypothetical protein
MQALAMHKTTAITLVAPLSVLFITPLISSLFLAIQDPRALIGWDQQYCDAKSLASLCASPNFRRIIPGDRV